MKQITVLSCFGNGNRVLQYTQKYNAILGISLNKRYFSKENVRLYCEWANRYCNKFLISLEDHEEMYNYMVFKNLSSDEALKRAIKQGETLEKGFKRVLLNFDKNKFGIQRSSMLFNDHQFLEIKNIIYKTYQIDTKFRDDLFAQLMINLNWKIITWKEKVTEKEYREGLKVLINYLLEEIAVVVFIQNVQGFTIDVYPSLPMGIIKNLYQGKYPYISGNLQLSKQYDYIYLNIEN